MAEALSVVGTAMQLGNLCFSIGDHIQTIKNSTRILRRYDRELAEVRELSRKISKNPLLEGSPEINRYTASLFDLIDQSGLEGILRKQRVLRGFILIQKQQALSNTFTEVERQKASLALTIDEITLQAVHQIQVHVSRLGRDSESTEEETEMSSTRLAIMEQEGGHDRIVEPGSQPNSARSRAVVPHRSNFGPGGHSFSSGGPPQQSEWRESSQLRGGTAPAGGSGPWPRANTANYSGSYAGPGVQQVNGIEFEGDANNLLGLRDSTVHQDARKEGAGEQRNGGIFTLTGKPRTSVDFAAFSGGHNNAAAIATGNSTETSAGKTVQKNGHKISFMENN
ncbi:spc97 / spc98 family domain-containing protein [Purpureocillium lavendulum]|uniref:Spc97 / spc98 family domain-containing protein n=1 Tax=Purpureocillium lavendulum TaxID=1247861 RepID=A0AB34FJT3_9HYPO|nr:spc97 / spc98 family domain-containing protein [Purpureocillium lavendulum]